MVSKPIQWVFGIILLIGVGLGVFVEYDKAAEIKGYLGEGAKRVEESIKANGCLTQNAEANIAQYLRSNGMDPANIYFNASTGRQSYGSTAVNGALGYDFTIEVPGFNLPIYKVYLEKEIPNVNSDYVTGMTADTSACVGDFSNFGGVQMSTTDLGPTPTTNVTNPSIPTSLTFSGPTTVTVGQGGQYSGVVSMGATAAPAGTQVEISSPNGTTMATTQADGSFSVTITFPSVGPQVITAKAGIGTAAETVTVAAGAPVQLLLTNPSSGTGNYQTVIGNSISIQGMVTDASSNPVSLASISVTSDTSDVPNQTIKTNTQGAFNFTYTPKSVTTQHVTFTINSLTATANVSIQQGTPQSITLQSSTGSSYSSSPLTITAGQAINLKGNVAGLYGSPVSGVTVSVASPTDGIDNMAPNGSITTDTAGNFTNLDVVLTQTGTQAIQATTAGINSPAQIQVNVNPAGAAKVANLAVTPDQIASGGTVTVTGQILDSYGNPVQAGTALTLVGPVTTTNATTGSGGQFALTQTVSTPGMATLKVQSNGATLNGGTVAVNVLPTGAYSLAVSLSSDQVLTGGSLTATITLKDNTGTPISGKSITLSESPEPSALVTTHVTTDNSGQASVTVGPVTKVGYESLTAAMDGVANVIGTSTFQVLARPPSLLIANVSPSTTQVWTASNPVPLPVISGTVTDSYANPIFGASVNVSGGYGANVSGSTDSNGYYSLSVKPTNIGGPFALSFAVSSTQGNFNTVQGSLTVTAPITVPVDKVLAGTVIAGQTGTMPNKVGSGTVITPGPTDQAIPQGYYGGALTDGKVKGVVVPPANVLTGTTIAGTAGTMPVHIGGANVNSLSWWTGGGSTVYLEPPVGYYDGSTWTYYTDPNLVSRNIKNGVSILGVTGTAQTLTINAGDAIASESTTVQQNTSSNWVQYQNMGFRINTPGTYRLKFDIYGPSGGTSAYGQVRVNGTTVGTTFKYVCSYPPSVWETMQEDITLNAGDYVTLWFYADPYVGYPNSEVRNFSLCYGVANASSLGSWQ
ncbi:Ig-like domain-containing protein [Desulfosporosinus acidiphilus SJ4]|uniref:Ig-like domain-containing protein n=1 Tax=Desulfosporosinus acidiphilus (strain DSM 22704 / JCM 16185 / SJ4) TaxID=646529 RepID=I4D3T3_DESAJ|nr:Ig-like domain-containing protein [Desulfosporosinus acidiphilus]AFM40457.1 Ig-like domain-containing protein [Desulfosporosinus acidiphilus SJ4]